MKVYEFKCFDGDRTRYVFAINEKLAWQFLKDGLENDPSLHEDWKLTDVFDVKQGIWFGDN